MGAAPDPDPTTEPEGFVLDVEAGVRLHFLDWGDPAAPDGPPVLLLHGLLQTAWSWAPVARRLVARRRVVALDLRGHGLSDGPTSGFDPDTLAADVAAVAEGARLIGEAGDALVLAGHGLGGIVAAWTAARLGRRCAGLVLADGGWEDLGADTGMAVDEFLKTIAEPPEVYRSMRAWLADRRAFDPPSWDADQERAARAAVVEVPAGRVVPIVRPHVVEAMVGAMLAYRPAEVLPSVTAPITALVAGPDERGVERRGFASVVRFPGLGHNLMRYRPADVAAAILAAGSPTRTGGTIAATASAEDR